MKLERLLTFFLAAALAAGISACRPDEIRGDDPAEEKEKDHPASEVDPATVPFTADAIAQVDIVTDKGVPVDSKEEYVPCSVKVTGGEASWAAEVTGRIRGRGNSTWNWYPKKPYRIKLNTSSSFLGMASNKDWVLLADYRDVTHMMNLTGFYLARTLGLPHTNHVRFASVSLNGEDLGLYMVTEQVEEGGNRVQLDPKQGILLALDLNDGPDDMPRATDNFWSDVFGMAAAVKFPRDAATADRDRVKAAFAELEEAIDNMDWEALQGLLDVDSMIHYILVQEIIGNVEVDNDPSMRSGFLFRKDDKSKWVMGPMWDCDGGFSYDWSDMYDSRGWGHTFFGNQRYLVFGSDPYRHRGAYGATASDFFCRLFGIPEFVERLQARWAEVHGSLLNGLLDCLDETEALIGAAAQDDMNRWGIRNYGHAEEYRALCSWLTGRFSYLDGVIRNYPLTPGGSTGPSADAEITATLSFEVTYPQDGHHVGTFLYLSDSDKQTVAKGLGVSSFDDLAELYELGGLGFWAVEPDGSFNPSNTANAPGHWYNSDGWVTAYGQNSFVYSEFDFWFEGFTLGKHPTLCTPGEYEISQAFVYGKKAVRVDFHITVTAN